VIGRATLAIAALAIAAVTLFGTRTGDARGGDSPGNAAKPGKPKPSQAQIAAALKDWATVYDVLLSPRCRNCHPIGDRPLWYDDPRPHGMNISRRSPEAGLPCTTCHRHQNARDRGAPPGVAGWRMPEADTPLVFETRTSAQLCAQLVDPKQNGDRTLDDLVHHIHGDAFVLWSWNPGPGRTTPPVPHAEFEAAFRRWAAAGGPCPAP
jgi:hypothetical protein